MAIDKIKTPCIGRCSTTYGDLICRGCKRFSFEVVGWNGYTEEQKAAVIKRLQQLMTQVISNKVDVVNADVLKQQLDNYEIPYRQHMGMYAWAYDLLIAAAKQIDDINEFGIYVLPQYREMSLVALRDAIDREFFILSDAHYERYFTSV